MAVYDGVVMSGQGNPRRPRVAQAMRDVLAPMLDREIKDPRVRAAGFASINHIELNRDMSVARIYVSFVGPADESEVIRDRAMAALQASAGFLRGPVGRALRLRHAPELRFLYDDSPAFGQRISALVRDEGPGQDGVSDGSIAADSSISADSSIGDSLTSSSEKGDG